MVLSLNEEEEITAQFGPLSPAIPLLLIEAGAELNMSTPRGIETALDFALKREGFEAVVAALRARGGLRSAELAAAANN